jgi:hypothetical protein
MRVLPDDRRGTPNLASFHPPDGAADLSREGKETTMQATSTIRLTNHRTAAAALLAAGIFAAGAALGAVAGTTLLPETVQVIAGSGTSEHDAAGLRLQRQGEINAAGGSANASGRLQPRYEVARGK